MSGADSAVSVVEVEHAFHPAKFKVLNGDRLAPYFEEERGRMAAHELPHVYVPTVRFMRSVAARSIVGRSLATIVEAMLCPASDRSTSTTNRTWQLRNGCSNDTRRSRNER